MLREYIPSPITFSYHLVSFFSNTGAVAGVFVFVGLTIASILLCIFFAIRRRRHTRRLAHGTAASAGLATANLNLSPLDDENPRNDAGQHSRYGSSVNEVMQRSNSAFAINTISSLPSVPRNSTSFDPYVQEEINYQDAFNPYAEYGPGTMPSSAAIYTHRTSGSGIDQLMTHSAAGSYEPLLASYYYKPNSEIQNLPSHPPPAARATPPPRTHKRLSDASHSHRPLSADKAPLPPLPLEEHTLNDRLNLGLRTRPEGSDLGDNKNYSRPVLGVSYAPCLSQATHPGMSC